MRVPFADILFFGDLRWWNRASKAAVGIFRPHRHLPQHAVRAQERDGGAILSLERQRPPGLATLPTRVVFRRTSYSSAINLAVHLGCARSWRSASTASAMGYQFIRSGTVGSLGLSQQ
jgi:hypothetical protein